VLRLESAALRLSTVAVIPWASGPYPDHRAGPGRRSRAHVTPSGSIDPASARYLAARTHSLRAPGGPRYPSHETLGPKEQGAHRAGCGVSRFEGERSRLLLRTGSTRWSSYFLPSCSIHGASSGLTRQRDTVTRRPGEEVQVGFPVLAVHGQGVVATHTAANVNRQGVTEPSFVAVAKSSKCGTAMLAMR
jgi:hypothetical protein